MKRILIVAGDPSGDLIAAQLVGSMKRLKEGLFVTGLGGKHLESVSDRFLGNIVEQHAIGFLISPRQLLYFHRVLKEILIPELKNNPPDAVIPVDFYGFNSRVAKIAKAMGRRVFYYASPQFWASRPGRAEVLRHSVDLFLCLFPFEMEFYRRKNLPAQFVGHPALDAIPQANHNRPARVEAILGLLPGSRPDEVRRHLPVMMRACDLIAARYPGIRFMLFTVPHIPRDLYQKILAASGKNKRLIEIVQEEDYAWRTELDLAITASGMETLENALLGIPMVVMYKMNWITYAIARLLVRIPLVAMPNLLSGRELVPEYIQWKATPQRIADSITHWLADPPAKESLRRELLSLREKFGGKGASERAARAILEKVA